LKSYHWCADITIFRCTCFFLQAYEISESGSVYGKNLTPNVAAKHLTPMWLNLLLVISKLSEKREHCISFINECV